jgi:CheY-like chemotaxis protein
MARFKKVLLVEDDPITIMVCERIIKMTEFADEVLSCDNGQKAINHIKAIVADPTIVAPEIIFLDINMPVMNGWDFLEEFAAIKSSLHFTPKIYILSSTVDPEDYKKASSFGTVTSFLSKPLDKKFLDDILAC